MVTGELFTVWVDPPSRRSEGKIRAARGGMPDRRGSRAHESDVGFFRSGSPPVFGPLQWEGIGRSGRRQRWRAGRQTEPIENFSGGLGWMNRGENP